MCNRDFTLDENVKLHMIFIHGIYSKGEGLDKISEYFEDVMDKENVNTESWDSIDDFHQKCGDIKLSSIKYGKLLISLGRIPFVRNLITHIIASRLQAYTYKYPNAKTVVFAHSFGTWALSQAIETLSHHFRIDYIVLFGSVIKRDFDWAKFPFIQNVFNFVGVKDKVVLMSMFWGTGWSGRYGFSKVSFNLTEIPRNWGHTDYSKNPQHFLDIVNDIYCKVKRRKNVTS